MLRHLGEVYLATGEYGQAETCVRESLELFARMGSRRWAVFRLLEIGRIARVRGEHRRTALLFAAFKSTIEEIVPSGEVAGKGHLHEIASFPQYESDYPSEWIQGQSMTYQQAIRFALRPTNEDRV